MTLFQKLRLEVWKESEASFEGKNLAIKDHIVPDTARNLKIDILDEYSDEPVC